MKTSENEATRRDLPPRCRHPECVAARADELAAMGATHLAVEIHKSEMPVRCRKAS